LLSVITNIGWDHMNMLGDSLYQIAVEKAGIIKPGIPVIVSEYQSDVSDVFIDKALLEDAPISFASALWEIPKSEIGDQRSEAKEYLDFTIVKNDSPLTAYHLQLDLPGTYQLKNVKSVLSAVDELNEQGFEITDEQVKEALRQVKTLTGLHGRWEILTLNPLTICDTGHNPEGITEVLENIKGVAYQQLHFVMGVVNDKDMGKILAMLPKNATYYFCKPNIPRGLDAENLRLQAESCGLHGDTYPSVKAALQAAQSNAGENDLVFVGGSTFVVAEVI
jgi:dihydrofolate synthase/folylpolyglutamate synthase